MVGNDYDNHKKSIDAVMSSEVGIELTRPVAPAKAMRPSPSPRIKFNGKQLLKPSLEYAEFSGYKEAKEEDVKSHEVSCRALRALALKHLAKASEIHEFVEISTERYEL